MTKLDYTVYLKDKNFNFKEEYIKLFVSKFQICEKNKIKQPFKDANHRAIFKGKKQVSLEEVYYKFIDKKIENFDVIFGSKVLSDVLVLSQSDIMSFLAQNGDKSSSKKLKYFFNYDKFQSSITEFFTKNFDFRTCFYCNKEFITNFDAEKSISTFQLDHFYDKAKYPYLALSFYNLIPSCSTCNSKKVKGEKDAYKYDNKVGAFKNETCAAPNRQTFDFHNKVKFKLYMNETCEALHVKSSDDIDIVLRELFSDDYDKYIEIFKLNERYKAHKDIVFDMIQKAELYPESRLKELQDLTGIPFQQIKKDIFNIFDENENLSKKPFSKLTKDILEQLEII
jgi:hypothetical protein